MGGAQGKPRVNHMGAILGAPGTPSSFQGFHTSFIVVKCLKFTMSAICKCAVRRSLSTLTGLGGRIHHPPHYSLHRVRLKLSPG